MAEFTSFEVEYKLDSDDARDDANVTAIGNSEIADIALINRDNEFPKVITREHNYTILDGSHTEYDDTNFIGFWSASKSDAQGRFSTNPKLTINFSHTHTSYATTLHFISDPPKSMHVTWYHNAVVLSSMDPEIDLTKSVIVINNAVENYNKMEIEFTEALPDRYIKLDHIEYGTTMNWDETIIKSGTLVKGLNRLGDMLSIDTLDFELVDTTNSMNFGNPNGLHTLIKKNQAMKPKEIMDDVEIPLGTFYLDSFTNDANNVGKIHAVSLMGLLDKMQYNGSDVYNGTTADYVIRDVFYAAGIDAVYLDISEAIAEKLVYGSIPPKSCKEALQDVLFALHAVVDSSDPEHIVISEYSDIIRTNITRANKVSTSVATREYVTGVKLNFTTYTEGSEIIDISTASYSAGQHTVTFSSPYSIVDIGEDAVLVDYSAYSVTFRLNAAGTVTIRGHQYTSEDHTILIKGDVPSGEVENIREFSTTLCNLDTATPLVKEIFSYFNDNRLEITIQHYCTEIDMGDMRLIENPDSRFSDFIGMFEERSIDLTGGFFDSAKLVGRYDTSSKYLYTGTELYIDEDPGII